MSNELKAGIATAVTVSVIVGGGFLGTYFPNVLLGFICALCAVVFTFVIYLAFLTGYETDEFLRSLEE